MKRLSATQASRCEHASGGRCRCRCAGAFHGASRVSHSAELPDDDPHFTTVPTDPRPARRRPAQPSLFDLEASGP